MAETGSGRGRFVTELESGSVGFQRMELKYCERCGALGVQRAPDSSSLEAAARPGYCKTCEESLRWLTGETRS